jgi:hypothetical protein
MPISARAAERHQARDRQVGVTLAPVPGDDRPGGDVAAALAGEEAWNGQFLGQDRIRDDDVLARRRGDLAMRQGLVDGGDDLPLQPRPGRAETAGDARQSIQEVADDRQRMAADIVKAQRRAAAILGQAGGDLEVAIDALGDPPQLPRSFERRQECAHRLARRRRRMRHGVLRLSPLRGWRLPRALRGHR